MPHDQEEDRLLYDQEEDRHAHLRRVARRLAPDPGRWSRSVGVQYLFLALLVAVLAFFAPLFRWNFPAELRWLIPLYALGGLSLLGGWRRRRR